MFSIKLYDDSSNFVALSPDWEYEQPTVKIMDQARTTIGLYFRYSHGHYTEYKMKMDYITASEAGIVNSWWLTRQLCQIEITDHNGSVEVNSVMFSNNSSPFNQFTAPHSDRYQGTIKLSTY